VAIVWPCPLSVDAYVGAGRSVVVPRALCPSCRVPMGWWSGYWRSVRVGGRCRRLWLVRARCAGCGVTHALVPSFLLVGRLDVVESVGVVLEAVVAGVSGVRPAAACVDVPHTTARDWVRCFVVKAAVLWSGFAALTIELGGDVDTSAVVVPVAAAVAVMRCAHRAAVGRHEVLTNSLWGFVSTVTGGVLIRSNTDPPWRVFGNRCFIPPIPFQGS
jgi:hypothetical protein